MTIVQINYFLAAVAAGSLTQAADDLGIAQPTLSEQIRKLEQHLGVPLFTRAKQGLTLTEAGLQFLPHARRVATDYSQAMEAVFGIRDRVAGTVKVMLVGRPVGAAGAAGANARPSVQRIRSPGSASAFEGRIMSAIPIPAVPAPWTTRWSRIRLPAARTPRTRQPAQPPPCPACCR